MNETRREHTTEPRLAAAAGDSSRFLKGLFGGALRPNWIRAPQTRRAAYRTELDGRHDRPDWLCSSVARRG